MSIVDYQTMFTIETTNPIHFQLGMQITHYDNICNNSHDQKFYCTNKSPS